MRILKKLRESKGLTQADLSKQLKISPSTIGMYEQGRREPDITTLKKIAEIFNVTTDYLLETNDSSKIMNLGNNIRILREQSNMSQEALAKVIGVTQQEVDAWECSKSNPRKNTIDKLTNLFSVSTDYLFGRSSASKPKTEIPGIQSFPAETNKIPLIGSVKCGPDGLAYEYLDGYVSISSDMGDGVIALECRSDSMTGMGIFSGDTAIVRLQKAVESGQLAVVIVNGDEGILKKIRLQDNMIILESANPEYPPRVFVGEEMNNVKILGRVIQIRRTF